MHVVHMFVVLVTVSGVQHHLETNQSVQWRGDTASKASLPTVLPSLPLYQGDPLASTGPRYCGWCNFQRMSRDRSCANFFSVVYADGLISKNGDPKIP